MRNLLSLTFLFALGCGGTASQEPPPAPPPASPPPSPPPPTADAGRPCIQNVMCMKGLHWDPTTCTCVQ